MPRPKRDLPWLTKRDDGTFYANWYEAAPVAQEGQEAAARDKGRTRTRTMGTRDPLVAKARFAALLTESPAELVKQSAAGLSPSVESILDAYELEHVGKCADGTRQRNAIVHLKKHFGKRELASLDIPATRAYAEVRRSGAIGGGKRHFGERAKGSDSTIRRELNVLVAAIGHARRWKRLPAGCDPQIELPDGAAPDETLWLKKPEVDWLYANAEGPLKDFIAIAYYTAARRASIETLRVEQVDLARNVINLRKAGERVTKKRRPLVPIHPRIRRTIKALIAESKDGWLFGPTIDFYRPFRWHFGEMVERQRVDALKAAGQAAEYRPRDQRGPVTDERAHPHVLRHSRATHLLQADVSIYNVAKLLGDTIKTVENVYGKHSAEFLGQATSDVD